MCKQCVGGSWQSEACTKPATDAGTSAVWYHSTFFYIKYVQLCKFLPRLCIYVHCTVHMYSTISKGVTNWKWYKNVPGADTSAVHDYHAPDLGLFILCVFVDGTNMCSRKSVVEIWDVKEQNLLLILHNRWALSGSTLLNAIFCALARQPDVTNVKMVSKLKNELNAHMTGSERGCQFSPGQESGKK